MTTARADVLQTNVVVGHRIQQRHVVTRDENTDVDALAQGDQQLTDVARAPGWSPAKGSSTRRTLTPRTSARASATRRCCPPDSSPGRRERNSSDSPTTPNDSRQDIAACGSWTSVNNVRTVKTGLRAEPGPARRRRRFRGEMHGGRMPTARAHRSRAPKGSLVASSGRQGSGECFMRVVLPEPEVRTVW